MILERDTDLSVLHDAVTELRRGGSSVVLVAGEAGIGKTTLLTRFFAELPTDVRRWLGRCDDLVAAQPALLQTDVVRAGGRPRRRAGVESRPLRLPAGDGGQIGGPVHPVLGPREAGGDQPRAEEQGQGQAGQPHQQRAGAALVPGPHRPGSSITRARASTGQRTGPTSATSSTRTSVAPPALLMLTRAPRGTSALARATATSSPRAC